MRTPEMKWSLAPKKNGGLEREFEDTKLECISYWVDGFGPKKHGE